MSKVKSEKSKAQNNSITIINKIVLYLFYSLFFVIPLLMASVTSELFEFNKMLFIYFAAALISFLWILKMILLKKIIIKKTYFDIPIIIFLLSEILSTIFSIDRHTSLFGYYGRFNGGLISIIVYLILFYAFVSNIKTESVMTVLKTSLIASLLVILWGLPGKLGYDLSCFLFLGQLNNNCWTDQFRPLERMFSTLGQPNWLGAYLAINFFIAFYFFISQEKYRKYFVYLTLTFSAILFTRSRSALAAVMAGFTPFIVYLIINKNKLQVFSNKLKYLSLALVMSVLFFKTGIGKVDKLIDSKTYLNLIHINNKKQDTQKVATVNAVKQNITETTTNVTESFDIRKIVWEGAIELGKRYPALGTGVETFAYSYYFVRPVAHNLTSEWDYLYNKAHNEFLNYLATTGFIGLLSYVLMMGTVCFFMIKKGKDNLLYLCLFGSYITISVTNFFGFSTTTVNLFFYLIPAIVILLNQTEGKPEEENKTSSKLTSIQKVLIVFFSIACLYLISLVVRYWLADVNYAEGDKYYKSGYYQASAQYFQAALNLRNEHVYEDKMAYSLANLASSDSANKENDQADKIMKLAKYYNDKSINASPKNILYWKTKAKIYYVFFLITSDQKQIGTSLEALSYAAKIAPTDPKIPLFQSQFYALMADEEKNRLKKEEYKNLAFEKINKTLELKPNYEDALTFKSQLEMKYK